MEVSPLRLERYQRIGYDIEIVRSFLGELTIVLELKKEGYKATMTFKDETDATRWNNGWDNIPFEFHEERLSVADVGAAPTGGVKHSDTIKTEEPSDGPLRAIEL